MHHMGEALESHELRDAYRSVLTDAADIVAPEIHEHDMLGALLLVPIELFGEPHVLVIVAAAPSRSGARWRRDAGPFDADEHLWGGSDHRHAAHADEIH